jgi:hypothetical protein
MNSTIFWDITACSPLKVKRSLKHGAIYLKIEFYITTAVRTSNPSKEMFVSSMFPTMRMGL